MAQAFNVALPALNRLLRPSSILLLLGLLLLGCSPSPTPAPPDAKAPTSVVVRNVSLEAPAAEGDPHTIRAELHHTSTGGPAKVTFRLRGNGSGPSPELTGSVQLTPGVVLVAVGQVKAPAGDYTPEVEVEFPAR